MSELRKLDDNYTIQCDFKSKRSGFSHIAILYKSGQEVGRTKVHYINRTWEKYGYQTVMIKLVRLFIEDNDKYIKDLR